MPDWAAFYIYITSMFRFTMLRDAFSAFYDITVVNFHAYTLRFSLYFFHHILLAIEYATAARQIFYFSILYFASLRDDAVRLFSSFKPRHVNFSAHFAWFSAAFRLFSFIGLLYRDFASALFRQEHIFDIDFRFSSGKLFHFSPFGPRMARSFSPMASALCRFAVFLVKGFQSLAFELLDCRSFADSGVGACTRAHISLSDFVIYSATWRSPRSCFTSPWPMRVSFNYDIIALMIFV